MFKVKRCLLINCIIILINFPVNMKAQGHGLYSPDSIKENMEKGDRLAVLMVHFGTTHSDAEASSITPLNELIKKSFPDAEFREAYSSRIIINILKKRGINKNNPSEALERLYKDGFTHIVVQTSNIIEGVEMEAIRHEVYRYSDKFKDIRCGNPLLYFPEDYVRLSDIICKKGDYNVVFAGHGSYDPATAQYAMLDYVMKSLGFDNCFVGTIEGYPSFEEMKTRIEKTGSRQVLLKPLMFLCGEHAKNDIAEDWKNMLEELGYCVTLQIKGLGEYEEVRNIIIENIRFEMANKKINISQKKEQYK